MRLQFDARYHYAGHWDRGRLLSAVCHLRVYVAPGSLPVVVVTELPENQNTSVTNRAEHLASDVWAAMLDKYRDGITWVEHYPAKRTPARDLLDEETFSFVHFELDDTRGRYGLGTPKWRRVARADLEKLIGQPFAPIPGVAIPTVPVRVVDGRWPQADVAHDEGEGEG